MGSDGGLLGVGTPEIVSGWLPPRLIVFFCFFEGYFVCVRVCVFVA